MKISMSKVRKGMNINGWFICEDVRKVTKNKYTRYRVLAICPSCGEKRDCDASRIAYNLSKKCKYCNKVKKYSNDYNIIDDDNSELILTDGDNNSIKVLIDTKYIKKIKKFSWGITSVHKGVYIVNTRGNRVSKNESRLHRYVVHLNNPNLEFDGFVVDHINRNTLDNRAGNLNVVTQIQNSQNRTVGSNSSSGVIGVRYNEKDMCWGVSIQSEGSRISISSLSSFEDAVYVRRFLERRFYKYLGEISTLDYNEDVFWNILLKSRNTRSSKSGYKGVTFEGNSHKWLVRMHIKGVNHRIGSFTNLEDAIDARNKFEKEYLKGVWGI